MLLEIRARPVADIRYRAVRLDADRDLGRKTSQATTVPHMCMAYIQKHTDNVPQGASPPRVQFIVQELFGSAGLCAVDLPGEGAAVDVFC